MRAASSTFLLVAGVGVLTIGVGLQVLELVLGGWPTLIPALLIVYSLPFVAAAAWARRRVRRPRPPWLASNISVVGLPVMAAGFLVWFAFTDVQSRVVLPATWSYGEPAFDAAGSRHIVLEFQDHSNRLYGIYSNEVARYLAGLGDGQLEVEFELSRDFGRVRGIHLVRIGSLTGWRSTQAYSGCRGSCTSPW